MLIEFTGLNELPIFVAIEEIAAIEEKKNTNIILKSGKVIKVLENAGDIYREIETKKQEQMLEGLLGANNVNF